MRWASLSCTFQTVAHTAASSKGHSKWWCSPIEVMHLTVCLCLLQFQKQHVKSNFNRDNGKIEVEYFKGGRTNMAYNCLDRHVKKGRGDQPCFLWEGNELDQSCCMTYKQVLDEVSRLVSRHCCHYIHHFLPSHQL